MQGLRKLISGGRIVLELRGIRKELEWQRAALERIAAALELRNAHDYPQHLPATEQTPVVEVTYVDNEEQAQFMEIEMRLTRATGQRPTEEDILAEYERLRETAP